jgi:2-aminoethylphosphonate transport system substrate-binding protein
MSRRRTRPLALLASLALAPVLLTGCGGGASGNSSDAKSGNTVVVYTADGLNDGDDSYYHTVFGDFTKETGIKVEVVEAGSGEVVQRVKQESSNTKADLLVTLPPFIQKADQEKLLKDYSPKGSDKVPAELKDADGAYTAVIENYFGFIRNTKEVKEAPSDWEDLLDASYKGRLQYSTPGVAGDGTALMLLAREALGAHESSDYFTKLQKNNVGPSSSTGQLAAQVNKGDLKIANGDVQMNYAQQASMPNLGIFFLNGKDGKPTTLSLPYYAGLVKNAPHEANAEKLLDYLLTADAQKKATTVAGGYPARSDVEATGKKAQDLAKIMDGVKVIAPDWNKISGDLDDYVDEWNKATGSL